MSSTKTDTANDHKPQTLESYSKFWGRKRKYEEVKPFNAYLDKNFNLNSEVIASSSRNSKRDFKAKKLSPDYENDNENLTQKR